MKVKIFTCSEKGLIRKDNQDTVVCLERVNVFAVADGMGGGEEGALASRMVGEELERLVISGDYRVRLEEIDKAIVAANTQIFEHAKSCGYKQMGSTVALLALDGGADGRAAICHVGDSRVYRVRKGMAESLTRDHSVGAELEEKVGYGKGHRFAVRSSPLAHLLTRVIGSETKVSVSWRKINVAVGDRFVICSDGVHDVVEPETLARLVADGDLIMVAKALSREVVRCGARDNYSFVLVEIGG